MDLARVRWENVAKLGAVLAVLAVVVLWPRLEAPAPVVPDGAVRSVGPVAPTSVPAAPASERPRSAAAGRREERGARPRPRSRPRRRDQSRVVGHSGPQGRTEPAAPAPAPAPSAPAPAPPSEAAIAAAEFAVEP